MSKDYTDKNPELGALYSGHIETVCRRHDHALARTGAAHVVIFSGRPKYAFLDDRDYPFRANPHFVSWAPLVNLPLSYIVYTPGETPVLVYYQPKYDLTTGKCLGMEALVRWDHPEKGLVAPDEFIPLAEETGMILQLDDWVIRTACMQLSVWKKAGYEVTNLAINVSARQFKEHRLAGVIHKVLEETGVEGHELEIELTESTLVDNNENAREMLNELHEMGLRIALDDFGTGYASMSYLKDFPIDTVKIDRSFVWGIPNDKEDMAIVKAIAGLAEALDLSLIAEGVETEQQIEFLNNIGCKYAQGYYWSKPVSAIMFEQDILKAI